MECSLCCEAFAEEGAHVPRNLDCGHTFCTVCIERLEAHAPLRQGPRCPDCRAVIRFNRRTVQNLPKNFKLLELIREQRGQPKKQTIAASATDTSTYVTPVAPGLSMTALPAAERRPGMMFMGNYLPPLITTFEEWMHPGQMRPLPSAPLLMDDLNQLRRTPTSASDVTASRNRTPSAFASVPSPEAPPAIPEAVENGRAVTGPNGTLVCKFFQEGTCRYGHHCWFNHPVHNPNKSMCRHWMKGQCRMGLSCNFRHGTTQPCPTRRPPRQSRPLQDPSAPGPSGEGRRQPDAPSRPSVVVFVTDCGSTIRGNLHHHTSQAGAADRGFGSDAERFFDDFGSSFHHQQ